MKPPRILLLGKEDSVLTNVLATLQAAGFDAEGTTQFATVHDDFDARNFTLIGLGGAFSDEQRRELRVAFQAQSPTVRVLDLFAPVLLPQLQYLTNPAAQPPMVNHITTTWAEGELCVELRARVACPVTVTLYDFARQSAVLTVFEGTLPAGTTQLKVQQQPGEGFPHFLVVQTTSGEVQVHRFAV